MIDTERDILKNVTVPEKLIPLLKEFTKTMIRQQPDDVLTWSERYFRRLVEAQSAKAVEKEITVGSSENEYK